MGETETPSRFLFKTREYRVSRMQMAYLTAEEYVRTFWWYVAIIPCFGLMALIGGQGNLQIVGLLAVLWPISIPARAILTTTRSAALFGQGAWVGFTNEGILVHGDGGKGLKLEIGSIRDTVRRQRFVLVRTKRLGFLPIPEDAFYGHDDPRLIEEWVQKRLEVE